MLSILLFFQKCQDLLQQRFLFHPLESSSSKSDQSIEKFFPCQGHLKLLHEVELMHAWVALVSHIIVV